MYIIIYEDGDINYIEKLDNEVLHAADDGLVDIIDISDNTHPLRYFDEGWCSLDVANA